MTISITFPPLDQPVIVLAFPGPGQGNINDMHKFTNGIPILPGSHLLALTIWTSRQVFSRKSSVYLNPFMTAYPVRGFWTFVDGMFVLLFGANVMYFAFGLLGSGMRTSLPFGLKAVSK
ncbi:hypothetical protein B0H10DRAFT_1937956 [Mycena sp. CBHHK59/15]|nr:hypothetical protein B0H10DRAFT_1937956 [Mycena sp. CBHHK59/15]